MRRSELVLSLTAMLLPSVVQTGCDRVRIVAEYVLVDSKSDEEVTAEPDDELLPAPAGLMATDHANHVLLSWQPVPGATDYLVSQKYTWQGESHIFYQGWTADTTWPVRLSVDDSAELTVAANNGGRLGTSATITVTHHQSPLGRFDRVLQLSDSGTPTRRLLDHAVSGNKVIVMDDAFQIYSVDAATLAWSEPAENPDACYVDPLFCGSGACFAWDPRTSCLRVSTNNGSTWSLAPASLPGGGADWLAYGNGRLLSTGSAGTFVSMDLGASWMPLPQPRTHGKILGLQFANGLFYLLTAEAVLTTEDGKNWVEIYKATDRTLNALFFAPDLYVRFANEAGSTLLALSNGVAQGIPISATAIAYGNGTWLAVGRRGQVFSSHDRVSWQRSLAATTADLDGVEYVENAFVAVSYADRTILRSLDGVVWTINEPARYLGVVQANERFAVVRSDGVVHAWSEGKMTSATQGDVGAGVLNMTTFAAKFVVGRADGSVMVSSDGLAWSKRAHLAAPVRALCASSDRILALGDDNNVMASTDTITWLPQTTNLPSEIGHCAYGAHRFVLTTSLGVSVSSDGATWDTQPLALEGGSWPIAFDDSFLLAAYGQGLFRSPNADAWAPTGQRSWANYLIAGAGDTFMIDSAYYNWFIDATGVTHSWSMPTMITAGLFLNEHWLLLTKDGVLYDVPRASRIP